VFVERTFGPDMKVRTLTMTKEIEKAMEDDIKQLPWMSEATRQQALLKLHSVTNKIGYPDKWRDYSSIHIERGDFAGNVYRAAVFEGGVSWLRSAAGGSRRVGMTPPTVNAYYDPQMNDINFPAGVLQPPVFDPRWTTRRTTETPGHHRSRIDAWLRRRGAAVRRARQLARLVDGGGCQGIPKARRLRRRSVCAYTVVDDIKSIAG